MVYGVIEQNSEWHTNMTQRFAYSVDEVSKQTTLSKAYLRNEIRAGHLKIKRFGRRVLILENDLKIYLEGK